MNKNDAIRLINETFNNSFNEDQFKIFIKNLFNEIDESKYFEYHGQLIQDSFKEDISQYKRIGQYTDPDNNKLDILIVKLKKECSIDRARTMQRNFLANYLKKRGEKEAGIVAYYHDNSEDWRFSFVRMDYKTEQTDDGKIKIIEDLTPAKRYSFLVGKNEPNHTACQQLVPIFSNDFQNPTLTEIENAFSIEKVTKEFFNKYKELFLELKEELDQILEADPKIKLDFESKDIDTSNFAKKLLGQIVFLYFLQKKGWLGVEKDQNGNFKDWGTGSKKFLRNLFDKQIVNYDNFFNNILEPLFYEALATDRGIKANYDKFNCRIPFLNGGLFEPIGGYNWEETDIIIKNETFQKIFDTFDLYNFTVKEDEPLDKEVAVDPEMLGKVFENLLDIIDRKSKGAFYTPREIVHYMCQESLINYLSTELPQINQEDLSEFIKLGEFAVNNDIQREKKQRDTEDYKYKIPESIRTNAQIIDNKLAEIKICDPAIGSGAFPVGMMHEIVKIRNILTTYDPLKNDSNRTIYNLKLHAIQDSIYGVDIDESAVEIAKLRLWLSLIVDENDIKSIHPLPNLDYKIMQGNSLLEEFEGIKLFDENIIAQSAFDEKEYISSVKEKINEKQSEYLKLHSTGCLTKEKQQELTNELNKYQDILKKLKNSKEDTKNNQSNFTDVYGESKKKYEELKQLRINFIDESHSTDKKTTRDKITALEWEFIESSLKEQGKEDKIKDIQKYKNSKTKPFFIWKLNFPEIFEKKGGFDIVIANPPYGANLSIKEKEILKKKYEYLVERIRNTFLYFLGIGHKILSNKAILTFILPNEFLFQIYMTKARKFFLKETNILTVINLGENIFEAIVPTAIILLKKQKLDTYFIGVADYRNLSEKELANSLNLNSLKDIENSIILNTPNNIFSFESNKIKLISKLSESFAPFIDYCDDIANGICTSCDEVYIVTESFAKEHNFENNYMRPCIRGNQFWRYYCPNETKEYVLYITKDFDHNIGKNIYKYLLSKKELLTNKCVEKRSGNRLWHILFRNRYKELFNSPKILIRQTSDKIVSTIDLNNSYHCINSVNIVQLKQLYKNRIFYFTGLLNSKLSNFFYTEIAQENGRVLAEVKPQRISQIPISLNNDSLLNEISEYVKKIMANSNKSSNSLSKDDLVLKYEQEIDKIIYQLYGLTEEEIRIIEDSFNKED